MKTTLLLLAASLSACVTLLSAGEPPEPPSASAAWIDSAAPPRNVTAVDRPDDPGGEIELSWEPSRIAGDSTGREIRYLIYRSEHPDHGFSAIGSVIQGNTEFVDKAASDGHRYYYKVATFAKTWRDRKNASPTEAEAATPTAFFGELGRRRFPLADPLVLVLGQISAPLGFVQTWWALNPGAMAEYNRLSSSLFGSLDFGESPIVGPAKSSAQWFKLKYLDTFVIGSIISLSVIVFIALAKGGRKLFLRQIAGLKAIDEAVGRATEMGRSILFIPGIMDMDDVQTVAGVTILGRIAKTVAEYDTRINMPVSRSIVMTTARETIKEAYIAAGRPDAYSDDMVYYLTDEQFGYVAAVDGIMVREKPATCFYLGSFFAESLIMAETGNSIGAIQIAGTAMPAQLPFFVAACDYTLIGEELFAASAYLSGEPKQLGSLKGQDVGKLIAVIFILLGSLLTTLATITNSAKIWDWTRVFKAWFTAS